MKLCVFANDSLLSYYEKGEIKQGYFNPYSFFNEIHVLSLFDKEIEPEKVKSLAGNAELIIHILGKANLSNFRKFETKVNTLVEEINPDLIRSFNPLVQGWLAVKASKKFKIPLVVSLHTNYEEKRDLLKKRNFFGYLKSKYASKKLESFVMKNADAIICVYEFIIPYAKKMGAKNIHIIYNKINLKKFTEITNKKFESKRPTIISVGRLIEQKNHHYLIKSIKDLDANLLIIGDGPNFNSLNQMIDALKVSDKVKIIKRVSNDELSQYYVSCDIYAQVMENLGGIPMPVLEAMACGLPVVMSRHSKNYSEIIDDAVYFVDNNPSSFRMAFNRILTDSEYKKKLKEKSLLTIKKISGDKMEEKELELYKKLIGS